MANEVCEVSCGYNEVNAAVTSCKKETSILRKIVDVKAIERFWTPLSIIVDQSIWN